MPYTYKVGLCSICLCFLASEACGFLTLVGNMALALRGWAGHTAWAVTATIVKRPLTRTRNGLGISQGPFALINLTAMCSPHIKAPNCQLGRHEGDPVHHIAGICISAEGLGNYAGRFVASRHEKCSPAPFFSSLCCTCLMTLETTATDLQDLAKKHEEQGIDLGMLVFCQTV